MTGTTNPEILFINVYDGMMNYNNKPNEKFNYVGGRIIDIAFKTITSQDKTWEVLKVILNWENTKYQLELPLNGTGLQFMMHSRNIDLTKVIEIHSSTDTRGYNKIYLKQNDAFCKYSYTKDMPNGMPQWEKKDNGEWDSSKQVNFLKRELQTYLISKLAPNPAVPSPVGPVPSLHGLPDAMDDFPEFWK
jgi:hypothetical protein